VGRSQVQVRRVDPAGPDVDRLARLWRDCRPPARGASAQGDDVCTALRAALARDDVHALIASCELPGEAGGEPSERQDVGFLVLSTGPLLPLMGEPAVSIEHLFVVPQARRMGAAHALISRATSYAEQLGAAQISTSVPALGREGQRFFARLGFSPFVVRRVTTVSALRRRLAPQADPRVEATVVRRRSLRARSRAIALRPHATR
jgi:GNAT superfamily N-acetyltransferase